MENLEIILSDFDKEEIQTLVYDDLKLSTLTVKSSHFYDSRLGKDMYFFEVKSIQEIFAPKGTGNIVLEQLYLGVILKDVIIIFSFDEKYGDIVFNFPATEIFVGTEEEIKSKFKRLVNFFIKLKNKYDIGKIIIGYEPAEDEDTKLIEIGNDVSNLDQEIEKILE
ncbi:hypothetical protein [Bacillus canaveralius]|uniref:hypothetical protein n=1 Tax=Bacillus canaveralius TaxID=1403243 RepID=UPI000F7AB665|nr:hypothetical protein [Bacillus canaveralius]RSK53092.1 hypothetical protein EJA13_09460 [Bacillus canaveralius]